MKNSSQNSTQYSVLSTQNKTPSSKLQAASSEGTGENRIRLVKEQWLAVAAFLALTLPLAFVEPTNSTQYSVLSTQRTEKQPQGSSPVVQDDKQEQIRVSNITNTVSTASNSSVPTAAADNLIPSAANAAPQTAPANKPAPLPRTTKHKSGRRILVSIPDRKLAVLEGGKVRKVYRVAVGAEVSPSPAGEFHIAQKIVAPSYSHDGDVVAPGKGNPLGSRWMGLDKEHYGIHGTNMPQSIGHAASHGCIRMRKPDVEELFEIASVGDVVEIHDTRTEELAQIFGTEAAQAKTSNGGEQ